MNTKFFKLIIVVIIAILIFVGIVFFPRHYESIAFAENLSFGMLPLEVCTRYGLPDQREKSTLTQEVTYLYSEEFCGYSAIFRFSFVRSSLRHELNRASLHVDVPEGEINDFYEHIVDICREKYQSLAAYDEEIGSNHATLSSRDGAIFMTCIITKEKTSVVVTITRIW